MSRGKSFGVIEFSGEADLIKSIEPPLHQGSFFTILAGNPGSGKTNTALQLLIKNWAYQGHYDRVIWVSPSSSSFPSQILDGIPEEQRYHELTQDTLHEIMKNIQDHMQGMKVLIVFDDVMNELQGMGRGGTGKLMVKLISNRRHLTSKDRDKKRGGFVSVIIVSQVYNMIPRVLRAQADSVWMYKNSDQGEINSISRDLIPVSKHVLNGILAQAWSEPFAPLIINKKLGKFYKASLKGGQIAFSEIEVPKADWEKLNTSQSQIDADLDSAAAVRAVSDAGPEIDSAEEQNEELQLYLDELATARKRLRAHKKRRVR